MGVRCIKISTKLKKYTDLLPPEHTAGPVVQVYYLGEMGKILNDLRYYLEDRTLESIEITTFVEH